MPPPNHYTLTEHISVTVAMCSLCIKFEVYEFIHSREDGSRTGMPDESRPVSTVPGYVVYHQTRDVSGQSLFVTYLYAGIFQLPRCTYTSTASTPHVSR